MKYDLGEKVLNIPHIIQCSILILIGSIMMILFAYGVFQKMDLSLKILCGFFIIMGFLLVITHIHEILYGKLYKAIGYIEEFDDVKNYNNMLILVVGKDAHKFQNAKDEIAKLKAIKFVQYYNIYEKPVQYFLLPYDQLKMKW